MSSRSGYTSERMREIGRTSADQARNNLQRVIVARVRALTCDYCGVVSTEGTVDAGATVRGNSCVAYRWTVVGDGFEEQHVTHVRTDKAVCRGVAFPKGWKMGLQNLDIPDVVRGHVERAKVESRVPGLGCRLLGAPKRVRIPEGGHQVGAVVSLNGMATALCAHVDEDQWLCHRGSCSPGGTPDEENPWRVKDLEACNVSDTDAARPRKRIRSHLLGAQLRKLIVDWPRAFDEAAAVAAFRAEQQSASSKGRELDPTRVAQHFEPMAWNWPERAWDVNVYLLWSWHCRGMLRTALSAMRLDNLRDLERKISVPDGLGDAEYCLWRSLEQVAEVESASRKAPCHYLGVKLETGRYEPDPSRWIRAQHYQDGRRSHAQVWFEWLHVGCHDGRPHQVQTCVNDILCESKKRTVPHNPLEFNAVGAGFRFNTTFMKCVGVNVHPAVQFKGLGCAK